MVGSLGGNKAGEERIRLVGGGSPILCSGLLEGAALADFQPLL